MNNKRTFFQYVIPSVLSFALSGVYAIVDGFFVGNSIGDAGLSTINIAYPITAVLQSVGTGIGMGGSVKYSILKAAGNEKKAREFVAGATWLMLLFSAVLTVTVFFTSEKILSALGARESACLFPHKGAGNHAAHGIGANQKLPGRLAHLIQPREGDDLLIGGELKNAVGGGVNNQRTCF